MTSQLSLLRLRLARLSRVRRLLRLAAAVVAMGSSFILAAFAVFAIDFTFRLEIAERLTVMLVAVVALVWAFWRYSWPLLWYGESLTETALLVERRQQIDSDLVAALEFDSPSNLGFESQQLASAVVHYVSEATPSIRVFQGVASRELPQRLAICAAFLAAGVTAVTFAPTYATAFFDRVALGARQYPTRTRIERVVVNHTEVYSAAADHGSPIRCKVAQGRPLTFVVECSGQLPAGGTIDVVGAGANSPRSQLQLTPVSMSQRLTRLRDAAARMADVIQSTPAEISPRLKEDLIALVQCDAPRAVELLVVAERTANLHAIVPVIERAIREFSKNGNERAVFQAEIRRLNDDVQYKIKMGDAATPLAAIELIPLPIVQLEIIPHLPDYARAPADQATPAGTQLIVLEGSSVEARVTCLNKPLQSVWVTTPQGEASERIEFTAEGDDRRAWSPASERLLAKRLTRELRYDLQVVDVDGLSLESPIRGMIRVKLDKPPSATAKVIHKVVVPTATPVVSYRADDDFGISRLSLAVEIERGGEKEKPAASASDERTAAEPSAKVAPPEIEVRRFDVWSAPKLMASDALPLTGEYSLSLAPLKLAKGDRLKLTLEALDYRGENVSGQTLGQTTSEGVLLEVADEAAVLAAIAEADKRSEQQLSEIIERQLSGGGKGP